MNINKTFLWSSNLEFVFRPDIWSLSKKILYRAYGDTEVFKKNILNFFRENISCLELWEKIEAIFRIPQTKDLVFHFWEDFETHRFKFYISLYGISFKSSIKILSEIKKILWIHEYFLEKNFTVFDCIGFDIQNDSIDLKVYELVSFQEEYQKFLPPYIEKNNIKEVWFLKTDKRKKIFFRLQKPLDISVLQEISSSYTLPWVFLPGIYSFVGMIRYICYEQDTVEIYFV